MNLIELYATFLYAHGNFLHHVDKIEEANGIRFLCPHCFVKNNGVMGTHAIMCFTPGTILGWTDRTERWTMKGSSLFDVSLSPSVLLITGCRWHGFVENGEIRTC